MGKSRRCFVMAAVLLCLTGGCAARNQGPLDAQIQQAYEDRPGFTAEVKMIANLGDATAEYGGTYTYQKDAPDTFVLKTPDALQGIVLDIFGEQADNMTIRYENTVFDSGMPTREGLTPADAVAFLLDALRTAAPEETWEDTVGGVRMAAARYAAGDDADRRMYQIWLTWDSLNPAYAECYAGSDLALQLFFSEYQTIKE